MVLVRLVVVILTAVLAGHAQAQLFDTKAPHALLMDYDSGTVLFEKAADERFAPASMAKLMTVEYVFHELKEGRLKDADMFTVSEHAWRTGGAPSGGSAMYAELNSSVAVHDLLRGLIVQSGNDAAIVLAEGIAGSEPAFADLSQPARRGDRPQEFALPERQRPARPGSAGDGARPRNPRAPYHPRLSRLLPDLLRAGVHLEQDPPVEPQPAARRRHRRRRAEDRLHQGIRLRHRGLRSAQRCSA